MAKSKMTISDIQKALLSNAQFIKDTEAEEEPAVIRKVAQKQVTADYNIDSLVVKKYKILASYQNIPLDELLNTALNHYLKLKSVQLEQAILKLTEE